MDQGSHNIRQGIEDTRASLDDKLSTLESKAHDTIDRARETLDLRGHVAERPWLAIGAALAAGYVVGSMGGESERSGSFDRVETRHFRQGQPRAFEVQSLDDLRSRQGAGSSQGASSPQRGVEERGYEDARRSTPNMLSHGRPQSASSGLVGEFEEEINMLKDAALNTLRNLLRETVRTYVPAMSDQLDRMVNEPARQRSAGVSPQRADPPTQQREVGGGTSSAYGSSAYSSGTDLGSTETARKPYSSL